MNKKYWLLAPALTLMAQSASQVNAQDPCVVQEVPPVCQGGRRLTINVNSMRVSPPNLCARPGSSIDVNVVPNSFVSIQPKGDRDWPRQSGSSFTLNVPEDASGAYDYNVYFEDGSCIDPRISVD